MQFYLGGGGTRQGYLGGTETQVIGEVSERSLQCIAKDCALLCAAPKNIFLHNDVQLHCIAMLCNCG